MNTHDIYFALLVCLLGYNGCYAAEEHTVIINDSKGGTSNIQPSQNSVNQHTSRPVEVILDIRTLQSNDQVLYQYDSSDDSHTFTPRDGHIIGKVTKGETVLWDSKDYGFQQGSKVFVLKDGQGQQMFRVNFGGPVPTDPSEKLLQFEGVVTEPKRNDIDLTIPQSDSDDDEDNVENLLALNIKNKFSTDSVKYEKNPSTGIETFTALGPYRFVLITKGSYRIWRYDHGEFPNKALLLSDENGNSYCRLEFPKPEPKMPKPVTERRIKLPRDEEICEVVVKPDYIDPYKAKQLQDRVKVDLDVHTKVSSFTCDHERIGRTHIYKAKTDFLFHTVRVGDLALWRARDDSEFASKVEFTRYKFPGMFEVNIYHFVGGKKKYIKNVGPWRHVDLTQMNLYTVNVDSVFDTFGYDNSFDGTFGIFDAKKSFLFDRIIKYNGPGSDVTVIWQAQSTSEYAKRVVIDGPQPFQNTNFIMLIFANNKRKYLLRLNNVWTEVPY